MEWQKEKPDYAAVSQNNAGAVAEKIDSFIGKYKMALSEHDNGCPECLAGNGRCEWGGTVKQFIINLKSMPVQKGGKDGDIFIIKKGELKNIHDLSKPEFEYFLTTMQHLHAYYKVIVERS